MITAQTIALKYHKDARCIVAANPQDETAINYFFIVDDGEDNPILAWGYSAEEAWDKAAQESLWKEVETQVKKARKGAFEQAVAIVYEQQRGPNPDDFAGTFTRLREAA